MPQFDFYIFLSQSFGILISFYLFYFFSTYFYLVRFSEVLKFRYKLLAKTQLILVKNDIKLSNIYLTKIINILFKQ
jgi:hypothetical protein